MRRLLKIPFFLFLAVLLCACAPNLQTSEQERYDFVQDIQSGTLQQDPSTGKFTLSFKPNSATTWFSETPGSRTGTLHPFQFFQIFDSLFGEENPNSVLAIRNDEGQLISYPVQLSNPTIDFESGLVQCTVAPLTGTGGSLVTFQGIEQFGLATLFIDSAGYGEGCSSTQDCCPPEGCDPGEQGSLYCDSNLHICLDDNTGSNEGAMCTFDSDCYGNSVFCNSGVCTSDGSQGQGGDDPDGEFGPPTETPDS
jgi:hypothetical protein